MTRSFQAPPSDPSLERLERLNASTMHKAFNSLNLKLCQNRIFQALCETPNLNLNTLALQSSDPVIGDSPGPCRLDATMDAWTGLYRDFAI